MSYGCYSSPLHACIGGCDMGLLDDLDIRLGLVKKLPNTQQIRPVGTNQRSQHNNTQQNSRRDNDARTQNTTRNTRVKNTESDSGFGSSGSRFNPSGLGSSGSRSNPSTRTEMFPHASNSRNNTSGFDSGNTSWGRGNPTPSSAAGNANGNDGNEICCGCGKPAKQLTVRKEGPNMGKKLQFGI